KGHHLVIANGAEQESDLIPILDYPVTPQLGQEDDRFAGPIVLPIVTRYLEYHRTLGVIIARRFDGLGKAIVPLCPRPIGQTYPVVVKSHDVRVGAVVLGQVNLLARTSREAGGELQYVADRCPTEPIEGLVVVPH